MNPGYGSLIFFQMNSRKREVSKMLDIIRTEFYQFLSSLLMRSLITIQQGSENGYGF